MTRYRTIVADPPWEQSDARARGGVTFTNNGAVNTRLPYPTLSLQELLELPVERLAKHDGAHLYLWSTTRMLQSSFDLADAWGFKVRTVLVWAKAPRGFGLGDAFQSNVEFILFGRLGKLRPLRRAESSWYSWRRSAHSSKPGAFYDLVQTVSPGPYLELFARENRLGWDTWGNEALQHVSMGAA